MKPPETRKISQRQRKALPYFSKFRPQKTPFVQIWSKTWLSSVLRETWYLGIFQHADLKFAIQFVKFCPQMKRFR